MALPPAPAPTVPSPPTPPNPARRDPLLPVDPAARALAARLLRCADTATLATVGRTDDPDDRLGTLLPPAFAGGYPFASLVTVATGIDGAPLLLLSRLSVHTRALGHDPRCSLLLREAIPAASATDPLARPRLSLVGEAVRLAPDDPRRPALLGRFIARHPGAARYADFPDFDLYRIDLAAALLNGGFARAHMLGRADLLPPMPVDIDAFAAQAPAILARLDRQGEELRLLASEKAGETAVDGGWRAVGIDPWGLDLKNGQRSIRLDFDPPIPVAGMLARRIDELLVAARERND